MCSFVFNLGLKLVDFFFFFLWEKLVEINVMRL